MNEQNFSIPDYRPPDEFPHKVLIVKDTLVDEARDGRIVPIKVYYPADYEGGPLPTIIWSHGLGGSVHGAAFLSRYLCSHGYVIVHVQHVGTDSSLWEGKPGHPWDIIRDTKIPREMTLARFDDVPFVLDQLPKWATDNPVAGEKMDLSRLGMSGHSFGAMTTQVMAGQMFPDLEGRLRRLKEDRFIAGVLYSPVPISHLALDDPMDIYGSIDLPLFHMTGTDDSSPVEGFDYRKRLIVHRHSSAESYLMILDQGDHMVFNGSRGKLGQSPFRDIHEKQIKIAALAFWDAKLKNDPAAQLWMNKHYS